MLESSESAFLLAVSTINNVTVEYRLESFAIFFCNAWELLLKSHLYGQGDNIFEKKERDQPRRSIGLGVAIGRVLTNAGDPVRLNLEAVSELRDQASHLCIPFVPLDIMGLFQAGVLNYCRCLKEWTGREITRRVPAGMLSVVFDVDPSLHALSSAYVRRRMSAEAIRWVSKFQKSLLATDEQLGADKERFYIPVHLKLALVRNPGKADIVLSSGGEGPLAMIVEVPKDADRTHPYRQKEVVTELQARCSIGRPINSHDILCLRRAHGTDQRPDFYYKSKFGSPQYSEAFVDWIVHGVESDPTFLERARKAYRAEAVK